MSFLAVKDVHLLIPVRSRMVLWKKYYAWQCFGKTDKKVQSMVIMRLPAVCEVTGMPRSTLYLYIKKNEFPKPVKLGVRSVGWVKAEVDEWLAKRMGLRQ